MVTSASQLSSKTWLFLARLLLLVRMLLVLVPAVDGRDRFREVALEVTLEDDGLCLVFVADPV